MLTLLRDRQASAQGDSSRHANDAPAADSWATLTPSGRSRAAALFERCSRSIGELKDAQAANVSTLRAKWINTLANELLVQINELDADGQIPFVEHAFDDYTMQIASQVAGFGVRWAALERRYVEERDWLLFQRVDEATVAANRLDELYKEAEARINGAAAPYITNEDFGALERALNTRSHVALGELQVSRNRARDVHDLLDVVRELRVDGQDPEKFAPGWLGLVNNELASLEGLARRSRTAPGEDLSAQYLRLRDELRKGRDDALQGIAAQKAREAIENLPVNRVPIATAKMVVGAADAIVSPIIESARELYDEAQIGLYYVSGGRYQVKVTSSLMDAFAHGATRTEVLKGMIEGLVGTPGRLLKAAEDGDWEAVGKEAMNLYLLAKTIEESPKYLRRATQILATTRRALRVVRARTLGLRLEAPRLLPESPVAPREPVFLRHDDAGRPVAVSPRQALPPSAPTTPSSLPAEPTFLKHPPASYRAPVEGTTVDRPPSTESANAPGSTSTARRQPGSVRTMAGASRGKGSGGPDGPAGRRPLTGVPRDPATLPERLFELLEQPVDRVWSHTPAARAPLPEGEFRVGLTHPIETYRAFNEALAGAGGREVGAFYNELTGEYRVKIGNRMNVSKPEGEGWAFLVHSHPNPLRARTFRLPAPDDFEDLLFRFGNTKTRVREFVEYDVPGVGRWRVEYGFDPRFSDTPQYIRILNHDGTVSGPIRFEHGQYESFWSTGSVAVDPDSPQHAQFISNSHEWLKEFREQKERGEDPGAKPAISAPRAYDPSKVRVIRGEVSRMTSGTIDPDPSNGVPETIEPEVDDPKGI
ncbi:MAG TPA: hypothetical protein VLN49_13335, partial [Gemmatimonadaceae bacterium]|nr:hypothetical protein [Gemmatimonadaceae bacterium]